MAHDLSTGSGSTLRYFSHVVTLDDKVTFKADFVRFRTVPGGQDCTLRGEFLLDGESFSPRMPYSMINIGVPSRDLLQILTPVYEDLMRERKGQKG